MKKIFLVAALAVSSFFVANAQLGVHLNLGKSLEENAEGFGIGVDAQYLFSASDAFSVGPEIGFSKVVAGVDGFSQSTIWYQAVAKYFIIGSSEDGGFYPQANIGLATNRSSVDILGTTFSDSSTDLQYGLGIGYQLESGFDISARYNMVKYDGGTAKGLVIQVGMFF